MTTLKGIYYGFGAFIGLVCGTLINLIFYWLEQSGTYTANQLVQEQGYPVIGKVPLGQGQI